MVKSNMQSRTVSKCPGPRRSPMRSALPTTVKGMRQKRKPIRLLKKTKRASRRSKLLDANSRSKSKKVGGTSVIFLPKNTSKKSGKSNGTILKSPVISRMKIARKESWFMNHSKAREGVDFFCNLGQRVLQSKPVNRQKRFRDGEGGLTNVIVRGRPMAGGLEAGRLEARRLESGRLEAGGLGAAVAKVNGLSTGGPTVGAKRGIDLAEVPRGAEVTRTMGAMGTLYPGPVLNSGASLAGKEVVVPLTNRLPIIDFISTNEFNKMNETQKSSRRHNR